MSERRKFERTAADFAAKSQIFDSQKRVRISGDIDLKTRNVSEGGALLEWPRVWACETCSNCLAWVYNYGCKLKEEGLHEKEFSKELLPEMHINLRLIPGNNIEPVEILAKITWIRIPEEPTADRYEVGVCFVEEKKESDIKNKIQVIKKTFRPV